MTPKKLKELLGLGQKHMATLLNEDYKRYRSMERRKGKPISDAQRLFYFVANFRLVKGAFKTPLATKDKIVSQNLSIYVIEDLQKRLRGCASDITIYRAKLSKLEEQIAKYNREFDIVNEIQEAVPEADQDLQDRITLLKRQLIEGYTNFYYLLIQRKLTLSWKEVEYNMLVQEIERLNNQTVD